MRRHLVTGLRVALAAAAITLSLAGPVRAASAPPTQPGQPAVSDLRDTGVTLTWAPSTDDVAVVSYTVWQMHTDVVQAVGQPTTNTFTVTGLRSGTTYWFFITATDADGQRSPSSPSVQVTTEPGDAIAPTPPGQPVASDITETSVRLTWALAYDANNVSQYTLLMLRDGAWVAIVNTPGNPPMAFHTVTGLDPGTTYAFRVRALDPVGNVSEPSPTTTVTTLGGPSTPTCAVEYRVPAQWRGNFHASVRIINTDSEPVSGWRLAWSFPDGQQVTQLWSGKWGQNGALTTVHNLPWNGTISGGGSVSFGFLATWNNASNAAPASFTLNGWVCAVA